MGKNKLAIVLVGFLIVAAFFIGSMWTKIRTLEGDKGGNKQTTVTPQPTGAPAKVEVKVSSDDPVKGNPEAKVTIVEFSDFQCPYCGKVEPTIAQVMEAYKDQAKLIYKNYPLPFHENAEGAALAALCAKEQEKFWEYHDLLFENQESLKLADLKKYAERLSLKTQDFNTCLEKKKYKNQVQDDLNEGNRVGVRGTPAFFINGHLLSGAQPFENFQAVIDEELK